VGTTYTASYLIDKIKHHASWGYNIAGLIKTDNRSSNVFSGYQILGDLTSLEQILTERYIDIVIIATDENSSNQLGSIIATCEKAGVKTNIIPYYYKYVPSKPYIDDLDGLPIIDTRHVPLDNLFKNFSKRLFDIVFATVAIILTSPVLLLSALMVKLTSTGPVLFKQERVGTNRQNFYMYKFRSMRMQTDEEEMDKWTTKSDPRKTWWGSFIRKTSIDELPQFFNVLNGSMSVVGPRPERPYFVEKFKEEIPRYMIKHQVRPGITGWAQVNGYRGDTSIEARIEHDLYYIENWSLGLDVRIIFLTIFKGFINKNAY
jgi:Undecaprenyl-phosphate glucose phosphotransferase